LGTTSKTDVFNIAQKPAEMRVFLCLQVKAEPYLLSGKFKQEVKGASLR